MDLTDLRVWALENQWRWHPWKTLARLRKANARQKDVIDAQRSVAMELKDQVRSLRDQVHRLQMQPQSPEGVTDMGVEFVLVGFDRGGSLGKRLMASRNLSAAAFGMTDISQPPPRWKITALMENMLVIDHQEYAVAMDKMAHIWQNWERDERERTAAQMRRPAGAVPGQDAPRELEQ